MALRLACVAVLLRTITAHYMWMRHHSTAGITHEPYTLTPGSWKEAFITFSENPARADKAIFLKHVANRTTVRAGTEQGEPKRELPLTFRALAADMGALVAAVPAAKLMSLEGEAVWGLFPQLNPKDPPLLKYWFSAPTVTKPDDWVFIDKLDTNRLSVTLRVAECSKTAPASISVRVVTRFNMQNIGNISVKLFDGKGALTETVVTSALGVAIVELPVDMPAFAMCDHQVTLHFSPPPIPSLPSSLSISTFVHAHHVTRNLHGNPQQSGLIDLI